MAYWTFTKSLSFLVQLVSEILISKVIQLKWGGVHNYTMCNAQWKCLPLKDTNHTFKLYQKICLDQYIKIYQGEIKFDKGLKEISKIIDFIFGQNM